MREISQTLRRELRQLATPARASASARFFKTGKGDYGEGDIFIGVRVPDIRRIVQKHRALPLDEVLILLHAREHEFRLAALLLLVEEFRRGTKKDQQKIYSLYLREVVWINNWDLVDLSAPTIVGEYLSWHSWIKLIPLAHSRSLWKRRIGIVATFAFIRRGNAEPTLALARILLHDQEDLIQKATGWMLREVGKRVGREVLAGFLDQHAGVMPRTMLRYALELFPSHERARYMSVRPRGVK